MATQINDRRARITAKGGKGSSGWDDFFGEDNVNNIMYPLRNGERGLIFPYTPMVQTNSNSNYDSQNFSHSNYSFKSWQNSDPGEIFVTGLFTAGTVQEARYMLAAIHFLKSAQKGGFGLKDKQRGVPPPVFHFNYLGKYQFNNVPVVISNVILNYDNNVDYVPVKINNVVEDHVPASMDITVTLLPKYNTKYVRDTFDISKFRSGELLKSNTKDGFL
jgi:hypothetical protein